MNEVFEDYNWEKYWDDTTGRELKSEMVKAARAEEIATVKSMGVWVKVLREECLRVKESHPSR